MGAGGGGDREAAAAAAGSRRGNSRAEMTTTKVDGAASFQEGEAENICNYETAISR